MRRTAARKLRRSRARMLGRWSITAARLDIIDAAAVSSRCCACRWAVPKQGLWIAGLQPAIYMSTGWLALPGAKSAIV